VHYLIIIYYCSRQRLFFAPITLKTGALLAIPQQGYAFKSGDIAVDIFSYNDNSHTLEQGFDCKYLKDGYAAVDFAVSRYNQISLIAPSWLTKIDYSFKEQPGRHVQFTGTQGIGYFMLPSEFSPTRAI